MYQEPTGLAALVAPPDRRRRSRTPHRRARRPEQRIRVLGEAMDLVRPEELMLELQGWIDAGQRAVVANHNLHSLALMPRHPGLRRFYDRADLIQADSRPLLAWARLLAGSARAMHRCTYLDWREHFWSLAHRRKWRIYYLGGAPGVAAEAARRIGIRRPGTTIVTRDGYFDAAAGSPDNAEILAAIHAFEPHILMVGMGMPRQELWIADHLDALPDCVVFNVGAAFDYEADVQRAAPRWMGQLGLEWLFRLVCDPRRLFVRYCVEPWSLIGPAWRDLRRPAAVARRRLSLSATR